MGKQQLVNQFTKSIIKQEKRKNKVATSQITSTLIDAGLNTAFVNESCKSTGQVSKSQVIYRKLKGKSLKEVQVCFRENTVQFLKILKIYSRNRFFINSFDTTKEAFYGDTSKAEDTMYLHNGCIAKGSDYYYEYLTVTITCNATANYILDGVMVPVGCYMEDYVSYVISFLKEQLPIRAFLFDRGFGTWGIIYKLRILNVPYLIFWKKYGDWYKGHFDELEDGESKMISRGSKYNRDKTNRKVHSDFILIKQLEYEEKKYDWIFATNLKLEKAVSYVKLYKKRWTIETIYRVTDKIRIYTTSTNSVIRYFLFMFTCFVYNIWRFFQLFLGECFTLANHKTNMIIYMAKQGMIYPLHYDKFEMIANKFFNS